MIEVTTPYKVTTEFHHDHHQSGDIRYYWAIEQAIYNVPGALGIKVYPVPVNPEQFTTELGRKAWIGNRTIDLSGHYFGVFCRSMPRDPSDPSKPEAEYCSPIEEYRRGFCTKADLASGYVTSVFLKYLKLPMETRVYNAVLAMVSAYAETAIN